MDYKEHERTYESFIKFSKIATVSLLGVVVSLAMFSFGGNAGAVASTIMIILNIVATGVGLASNKSPLKWPITIFLLTCLIAVITIA